MSWKQVWPNTTLTNSMTRNDDRLESMSLSRPPCAAKVRQSAGHLWFDIAADWLRKWCMKNWIGARVSPHVRESGFRISWALESGIQLKESGIPLTIRIQNLSSTDKETRIQYLESGIESVESRIQDCRRFRYMGQCVC